jgi:hypothetical protein
LNLLSTTFPETLNAAEPAYQLQLFQEHTDDADFQAFDDVVAMRDIAQRLGSKFLVILTPTEVELFRKDFDGIAMRVRSFSQREGIAFADPIRSCAIIQTSWISTSMVCLSALGATP